MVLRVSLSTVVPWNIYIYEERKNHKYVYVLYAGINIIQVHQLDAGVHFSIYNIYGTPYFPLNYDLLYSQ
jgi:hypothetical protein